MTNATDPTRKHRHSTVVRLQRARHHAALYAMLPKGSKQSGLETWRKLRRIEARAQALALRLCNGPELSYEAADAECDKIKVLVAAVFGGTLPPGFFVNRDPRGYALKLEPGSVPYDLHRDMGGYQILAPEIE